MRTTTTTSLVLAALLAASSAQADSTQLIRHAGLSPAEAEGMSLSEIAGAKFNRSVDGDERQPAFRAAAASSKSSRGGTGQEEARRQLIAHAGLRAETAEGLSLDHIAAMKFNRSVSGDEYQPIPAVAVARSRSGRTPEAAARQLVAAARLSREEASGLSTAEIAERVLRANASSDDR